MRTDLGGANFAISAAFKWNFVALDSKYVQTNFIEKTSITKPTGGAPSAPTLAAGNGVFVINKDTAVGADPLLVG